MDPELERFLAAGEKPILFTAGTGQFHAAEFFQIAARVVSRLGCRAVFLTIKTDQVPPDLPDFHFRHGLCPLQPTSPARGAMVHHGGIGTLSQCLAAGIAPACRFHVAGPARQRGADREARCRAEPQQ